MSKPGADPSSGISLGDALRLPERHPACRRREAQSGSRKKLPSAAGPRRQSGVLKEPRVQLVRGLIRTKPMNDLGADGAPQAYHRFIRCGSAMPVVDLYGWIID